ncbi:hypothetical protein ZWY2020_059231, partial [Hordeum vulgare]
GRGGPRGSGGRGRRGRQEREEGDSPYLGYDVQHLARWVEHALPFSLLLLGVFIRFFVMISISVVMFKSNDILGKQTALKATWLGKRCCRCHAELWFRSTPTIVMPHRGCRTPCKCRQMHGMHIIIYILHSKMVRTE